MNRSQKRLIEKRLAGREGKRFAAFYRGARDRRAGREGNPFPPGSDEARGWEAGWKYADAQLNDPRAALSLGPGGDFVEDILAGVL